MARREAPKVLDPETLQKLDGIFNAFEKANGDYPNSNPGIITELGYAFFKSGVDPITFADLQLSKAQIDSIARKMSEMHRAVGVSRVAEGEPDAGLLNTIPFERLNADWERFKRSVLIAAVMYSERALEAVGKGPKRTLHQARFDNDTILIEHVATDLADYLDREPWLREELTVLYETLHQALHSPEVEKEYGKLRQFLTYKKRGVREPGLTRFRKSLTRAGARQPVIDAFQEKAAELISNESRLSVKPSAKGLGVWDIR